MGHLVVRSVPISHATYELMRYGCSLITNTPSRKNFRSHPIMDHFIQFSCETSELRTIKSEDLKLTQIPRCHLKLRKGHSFRSNVSPSEEIQEPSHVCRPLSLHYSINCGPDVSITIYIDYRTQIYSAMDENNINRVQRRLKCKIILGNTVWKWKADHPHNLISCSYFAHKCRL